MPIRTTITAFEDQGAEFDTADLLRVADDGRGIVACLELPVVQTRPQLFSTSLMWLLADLFQDALDQTVRLIRSKGVGVFFGTA